MKQLTIFLLFILLSTTASVNAQSYNIQLEWDKMSDSTIYLAHYFDTNIYINDTLVLNNEGKGVFEGDSLLDQGLYAFYQSGNNYIDVLVGEDQTFSVSNGYPVSVENIEIEGAEQSESFLNYQKKIKKSSSEKQRLIKEAQNSEDQTIIKKTRERINALDQEIKEYIQTEVKKHPNTMYSVFLKAVDSPSPPEPDVLQSHPKYDSIAWFQQYFYNRDHFLDGINFTDERIINTPILHSKLKSYFNAVLIQNPDSLKPQVIRVIRASEPNKRMYQYVTQFFLNNYTQSKVMGMDALFVAIADEVYLKGKAFWADSTTIQKIAEEAYLTRPNLIGKKAPELVMETPDGEYLSLHGLQADYTILIFYEYDCGHCKTEVPALYNDVFMKYLNNNIEVLAVNMNNDKEKWEQFIEDKEIGGWNNVWDPQHNTKFRFKYNVKMTPMIYLLDEDKKIVAKKIDKETLIRFIDSLLN
ncbi:MAG: redoxin domain-containing protein [Prolixibacteraceae bacterium]|jgi:peroxiredoxin/ribosomal protein S20|nr:redoxin domain-containing protein [Prolixibacteraceae bacterium]